MTTTAPPATERPRRRLMPRRWWHHTLLWPAVLIVLGLIGVQIALWTPLPRRVVIGQLENKFGLRFTSASLVTGWFGHTTLHDVTLALPLADQAFATVPTMRVRHSSLLWLALTRSLRIDAVVLEKPQLHLVQRADGRWNLQDALELVVRNTSRKTDGSPSAPKLPDVSITSAQISIIDRQRRAVQIAPVDLSGQADSALSWKYDLQVPGHLKASGRVAPGDVWQHTAELSLSGVGPWLAPWVKSPPDLALSGSWSGRVSDGQVIGRLEIASLLADRAQLSGAVALKGGAGSLELRPDQLRLQTPYAAARDVRIVSGAVDASGTLVRATGISLLAYGGPVTLGGFYDLGTRDGQIQAAWDKLQLGPTVRHGGNLTASIRAPFPGQIAIDGTLFSFGNASDGPWRATIGFGALLDSALNGQWHVDGSELVWNRKTPLHLDGLKLAGVVAREGQPLPTLTLNTITLPSDSSLHGSAQYQLSTHQWNLTLSGQRWPLHPVEGVELAYDLSLTGTDHLIQLQNLSLRETEAELTASGTYQFGIPKPLHIDLKVDNHPASGTIDPASLIQGPLDGSVELVGTVEPRALALGGWLRGAHVSIAGRTLGDVALQLTGQIDDKQALVRTEQLNVLDGNWGLRGTYDFDEAFLDLNVQIHSQPLENLAKVAKTSPLTGRLNGEWDAFLYGLRLDPSRLRVSGGGSIQDLRFKSLAVDEARFSTTMQHGRLQVTPIVLKRGANGRGTGSLTWQIGDPRHLDAEKLTLSQWPLEAGVAHATVSAAVEQAAVDLPSPAAGTVAAKPLRLTVPLLVAGGSVGDSKQSLGTYSVVGRVDGQRVTIDQLNANLLGGSVQGNVGLDLARPLETRGEFVFDHLDAARVAHIVPAAQGLEGLIHGAAHLRPAEAPRPLEPLAFGMTALWDRGHFRTVPITQIDLNLFTNGRRFVLDDREGHDSRIFVADGTVRVWGRVTRRRDDLLAMQSQIHLENLDLEELVHAADINAGPSPGRVSGDMMFLYDTLRRRPPSGADAMTITNSAEAQRRRLIENLYGEARIRLKDSSIGALPLLSNLYDVMSLGQQARGPTGYGSATAHLEDGTFTVERLRFVNKGVEARAQCRSPAMWNFPDNPVTGSAVGTAQPLAALKIPFAADIQGALTALQPDLTTVAPDQDATWRNLRQHVHPIPFAAVGQGMRDFIFGDISGTSEP